MGYTWHFSVVWDYSQVFLRSAVITAELTLSATLIGVTLGLALGLMRRSQHAPLRTPASIYIEAFRSTPILVQLVWIYYALPILSGLQMGNITSVAIGLGLHAAAYLPKSSVPASIRSTRDSGTPHWPSACSIPR